MMDTIIRKQASYNLNIKILSNLFSVSREV